LLAEAGYPDGFSLTLGAPNGRYLNDIRVAETVAAMWTSAGVRARVEAAATPVFFKNRDEHRYSAWLAGRGTIGGEMSEALRALVATPNPERGMGNVNKGRYSSPAFDAKLAEALRTLDTERRHALLQEASKLAIDDVAILPLYFELAVWAMRKGLAYPGRVDHHTLAWQITPAP
jgi:peptide/nickel transport system substrate-binding protein